MADNRGFFQKAFDFMTKARCPSCQKSGGRETRRDVLDVREHVETVMCQLTLWFGTRDDSRFRLEVFPIYFAALPGGMFGAGRFA